MCMCVRACVCILYARVCVCVTYVIIGFTSFFNSSGLYARKKGELKMESEGETARANRVSLRVCVIACVSVSVCVCLCECEYLCVDVYVCI
ncbi:MAG TPA: hypothetical protein V6C97_08295 [Oculatellaceae cyanobacterium]